MGLGKNSLGGSGAEAHLARVGLGERWRQPCFQAENEYLIFQQILSHPVEFEYPAVLGPASTDFITKLLVQVDNPHAPFSVLISFYPFPIY